MPKSVRAGVTSSAEVAAIPPSARRRLGRDARRRAFSARHLGLLVLLVLCVAAALLLADPGAAFAQDSQVQRGPELMQEGGGRPLSPYDWWVRLPIALGAAALVIVVDAVVILRILRNRGRAASRPQGSQPAPGGAFEANGSLSRPEVR